MLKHFYDTEDEIPAEARSHFAKGDDGKYYLQCDGVVPKTKLEEFRTTNVGLLKERDDLKKRYDGVDPDEWRTLKERKDLLDQGKLVSAEGVDAAVKKRTEAMLAEHTKTVEAAIQRATASEAKVAEFMIDGELMKHAAAAKVKQPALTDVLRRGREVFGVKDGKLDAHDDKGNPIYGIGGESLTPKEYIDKLVKEAPHLFEESNGTGAAGNTGKEAGPGDDNPFMTATWNLTKQSLLLKSDPSKAAKLKALAVTSGKFGAPKK